MEILGSSGMNRWRQGRGRGCEHGVERMGDSGLRRQRRDAGKDQVWEAVVLRRVAMRDQMRLGLRGIKHGLATEKPRTNSVV
ncbi:hypothetical protein M0R45_000263 [Rubus argutus]|uniref:Uncharacterized protein n=1 Tax=Rubus argutus TaxID=59490 RepID=A0AAW1VN79_RUBAR